MKYTCAHAKSPSGWHLTHYHYQHTPIYTLLVITNRRTMIISWPHLFIYLLRIHQLVSSVTHTWEETNWILFHLWHGLHWKFDSPRILVKPKSSQAIKQACQNLSKLLYKSEATHMNSLNLTGYNNHKTRKSTTATLSQIIPSVIHQTWNSSTSQETTLNILNTTSYQQCRINFGQIISIHQNWITPVTAFESKKFISSTFRRSSGSLFTFSWATTMYTRNVFCQSQEKYQRH
jgi:hypothetical protein